MKNFYLLYGDDKEILNKEINDLKKKISINDDAVIYYDIIDINNIVDEALTIGMFSSDKLIIIDSTSYLSEKKEVSNISYLEDYFNNYNSNSYLLFISNNSSIDSRKKLVKLISGKGEIKKIEATSDYLVHYVKDYLDDYEISGINISYFLSRCGTNINNINNELDKLKLYKLDDKVITKDDIELLVEENMDNSVYDLVNSLLKNDSGRAIKLYREFTENGMDVSQIIAIIAAQIRLLFQVKRLYNSGKSNDEIAKILEFKSVYRVKYLLSDSYYYSEDDLLKYLLKLADIDKDIKLGNVNGNALLELFIVQKDM
ncbi:MAG: DNA polymerase III subunit delta [Bacilli bacterium]